MLIVSETWFSTLVPDGAMEIPNYTLHCTDRTKDSAKSRGRGICIYINNDWCTNHTGIESNCSPELEYLLLKSRPFDLPCELISLWPDTSLRKQMLIKH